MFVKSDGQWCSYYGSYNTLSEASFACASDEKCEKIYDMGCNGAPYSLCEWNTTDNPSSWSCLYKKPGIYGNKNENKELGSFFQ